MRKTAIIALFAIVLFSCGKKDSAPQLSLSATKVDIKYNETTQITASIGSNSDYTWKSSDEFVGTVDASGKFEAAHIGETEITATNGSESVKIKITVSPTENFYIEPYIEIGSTITNIKGKEKRTLSSETATSLIYTDPSPAIRGGIFYLFDNVTGLTGSIVGFTETTANAQKVGRFYAERYQYEGTSDNIIFMSDRHKKYSLGIDAANGDFGFVAVYIKYVVTLSAKVSLFNKAKTQKITQLQNNFSIK